jgi:hypothetical protein
LLLRAGQSPLEPHPGTALDGNAARNRATPHRVGSREESVPPSTWTESGRTPVLTESSSSREAAVSHSAASCTKICVRSPTIALITLFAAAKRDPRPAARHISRPWDACIRVRFPLSEQQVLDPAWVSTGTGATIETADPDESYYVKGSFEHQARSPDPQYMIDAGPRPPTCGSWLSANGCSASQRRCSSDASAGADSYLRWPRSTWSTVRPAEEAGRDEASRGKES